MCLYLFSSPSLTATISCIMSFIPSNTTGTFFNGFNGLMSSNTSSGPLPYSQSSAYTLQTSPLESPVTLNSSSNISFIQSISHQVLLESGNAAYSNCFAMAVQKEQENSLLKDKILRLQCGYLLSYCIYAHY